MTKKLFNRAELRQFELLNAMAISDNQIDRIIGTRQLGKFLHDNGTPKCEAMWDELATKGLDNDNHGKRTPRRHRAR